jgi:hypothetical protein
LICMELRYDLTDAASLRAKESVGSFDSWTA